MGALNNSNIGGRYVSHQFSTGGWTCAFCGGYVIYGNTHICSSNYFNNPPQPTTPQFQFSYPDPTLIELQNLLRQLIERVDRLIETFESN